MTPVTQSIATATVQNPDHDGSMMKGFHGAVMKGGVGAGLEIAKKAGLGAIDAATKGLTSVTSKIPLVGGAVSGAINSASNAAQSAIEAIPTNIDGVKAAVKSVL